jgi:solute:Na+ symporter, SSS family
MIDLAIIAIYLLITLIIGLLASRNITTMRDFTVASKNYPTSILIATTTATYVGSGFLMGTVHEIYTYGLVYVVAAFANPINAVILGLFVAPRIVKISYAITIGDIMQQHYGKSARVIVGVVCLLASCGYVGAQIKGMSFLFDHFLEIPYSMGVIASFVIIILYSAIGGIKSVTFTDFFQFVIIIVVIPMLFNVGLDRVGGFQELIHKMPETHLDITNNIFSNPYFIISFCTFLIPLLDPGIIQRILMAKDENQARNTLFATAAIQSVFFIVIAIITFVALVEKPDLPANNVLAYMIDNILPIGLKGLAIAGIMAVIMSTADSYLNVASIYLVHDIIRPTIKIKEKQELLIAKICTLIIGVIALFVAIKFQNILQLIFKSFSLWAPIVTVPLYAAIFKIKSSEKVFLASSGAGLITVIIYETYSSSIYDIFSALLGIIANFIVFVGLNYYLKNKNNHFCKITRD